MATITTNIAYRLPLSSSGRSARRAPRRALRTTCSLPRPMGLPARSPSCALLGGWCKTALQEASIGQQCKLLRSRRSGVVATRATSADGEVEGKKKQSIFNVPTMLTIARVAAVPALCALFYAPVPWAAPACAGVFVAASITDFLDGYLARKWNIVSEFGAFLDPVADKLMVMAVLILLCQQGPVSGPMAEMPWLVTLPTVAIIGREITMSALREWASASSTDANQAVKVNSLGKWKTATQMVAITILLLCRDGGGGALGTFLLAAGPVLLYISAILSVWSLAVYFAGAWPYMTGAQ